MRLEHPKKFRIWQFLTSHAVLEIRHAGSVSPLPHDEIMISFRATRSIHLPVFFTADVLEFDDIASQIIGYEFDTRGITTYKFVFKNDGEIVGKVDAGIVNIEMNPNPKLEMISPNRKRKA
jgi:hypothetical protein